MKSDTNYNEDVNEFVENMDQSNMKLVVCIMSDFYAVDVEKQLHQKGYRMTRLASSGGFLKKGNTTFLFGIDKYELDDLSTELQAACIDVENKKQRAGKHEYRYTSFLLPTNDVTSLLNF